MLFLHLGNSNAHCLWHDWRGTKASGRWVDLVISVTPRVSARSSIPVEASHVADRDRTRRSNRNTAYHCSNQRRSLVGFGNLPVSSHHSAEDWKSYRSSGAHQLKRRTTVRSWCFPAELQAALVIEMSTCSPWLPSPGSLWC